MFFIEPGFDRLQGTYIGTMFFYDLFEKKDKQMPIQVRFDDGIYDTKFRFSPPQYQWSVDAIEVSEDGSTWTERMLTEKSVFKLTNWKEFSAGTSNWFEIERPQLTSNFTGTFRRRWTLAPDGTLTSEKWLKANGAKDWEVSHRMVLRRI